MKNKYTWKWIQKKKNKTKRPQELGKNHVIGYQNTIQRAHNSILDLQNKRRTNEKLALQNAV